MGGGEEKGYMTTIRAGKKEGEAKNCENGLSSVRNGPMHVSQAYLSTLL